MSLRGVAMTWCARHNWTFSNVPELLTHFTCTFKTVFLTEALAMSKSCKATLISCELIAQHRLLTQNMGYLYLYIKLVLHFHVDASTSL